jgi:uncharacterized protein (TIGR02268 family)
VLSPSIGVLLVFSFLHGVTGESERPHPPDCADTARVDLKQGSRALASGLCITSSEPITFVFDSPLMPGTVVVESGGRAPRVAQGDDLVTLYPPQDMLPGERLKLTVRFADDAAPAGASFWLVGHSARGARRVEVFRHPRSADALQEEVVEARAEAHQCQEEKARLLAERQELGGLMGTAWLERTRSVGRKDLRPHVTQHDDSALTLVKAMGYSHAEMVAVRLELSNPSTEPWTVARAVLTNGTGTDIELSLGPASTIAPASVGVIVAGVERSPKSIKCPCTLELREAQGPRTFLLGNVTFLEEG